MTKLTYTLAIINGTVCYECQPSTPHAFYSGGGWFARLRRLLGGEEAA